MPNKTITADMIIQDVLDNYAENNFFLVNTFAAFGLRCVGCGSATHETIAQGAQVHGFDESKITALITDLNRVLEGKGPILEGELNISLDEVAAQELRKTMEDQGMVGGKLRLSISPSEGGRTSYGMKLVDDPQEGDIELVSHGVPVYVCPLSIGLLQNMKIIYESGPNGSGFRFEKQQS